MAVARVQGKIDRSATTSTALSGIITGELAPALMVEHPGIEIRIGGATKQQQTSQNSILSALMLGLVGVDMVLAFQFRSYGLPLIVMVAIPFAMIGSIPDLTATGGFVLDKVEGLTWVSTDNDGVDDHSGETMFFSVGTLD